MIARNFADEVGQIKSKWIVYIFRLFLFVWTRGKVLDIWTCGVFLNFN